MLLEGTIIEESHEDDEENQSSLTWQEIAENNANFITFERVIEDFNAVVPENEDDNLPEQLLDVANTILYISLGIKSVKSHKEDFQQLLSQATSLVVVFWQLYVREGIPGSRWPTPYYREDIDRLVNTVYNIYKFMKRNSQNSYTKRTVVGYFGLRDLGKFKKYQRELASVATGFEGKPNNVNISAVLLEVIKDRAQHPIDDDDEEEEETAGPVRKNKRAADQEASAERSRLRKGKSKIEAVDSSDDEHLEKNKTAKKTTRRQPEPEAPKRSRDTNFDKKSESKENKKTRYQVSDDDVEEDTYMQSSRTNNAAQSNIKKGVSPVEDEEDDCESMYADEESDDETPIEEPPAPKGQSKKKPAATPKQNVKSTPTSPRQSTSLNNGAERGTSRKGSRTNNAAPSKTKKGAVYDDEEYYDDDEIPVVDPVASEPRSKKKKKKPTSTPKQRMESAPVYPQYGNSFTNGSGNMLNHNVANLYQSTIEDAFNDNSVNTFSGRRKPA